jgi:uncharacterized delta-60 repeat protein
MRQTFFPPSKSEVPTTQTCLLVRLSCLLLLPAGFVPIASAIPPGIQHQPRNQAVILYQSAGFGVIASGSAPIRYQWRKNGTPIRGATNDQFVLSHAQFRDAALYSVEVSNAEGSLSSADAELTMSLPEAGDVDCSFACGGSLDFTLYSIVPQSDGKVLIGGAFRTVHGAARGRVARFNADGSTDYTFMNGLSGAGDTVYAMAVQPDGKVVIGGAFTNVNGVTRYRIARLNADGKLDDTFSSSASSPVYAIALQSDGKIVIGGAFMGVNGSPRVRIARLNSDGNLDGTFQNGMNGVDGDVRSIAVQADNRALIGGAFTLVNSVGRNRIARLNEDGSLDAAFQNGQSGANSEVRGVALQSDGKVLIGGTFTNVNGSLRRYIARLHIDGTLDGSFLTGPNISGANFEVESIALQNDGKILIGGWFNAVNFSPRNRIARLNSDGSTDAGFMSGLSGVNGFVSVVASQPDGKVLLGGFFTAVHDVNRNFFARLSANGTLDADFEPGFSGVGGAAQSAPDGSVGALKIQSDGKVLVGGWFATANGHSRQGIARFNPDGTLDRGFQEGLSGIYPEVNAIAVQSDGKVLAGGRNTTVNGVPRKPLARLAANGTLDSAFETVFSGANDEVHAIELQSDGKVLVGGAFTNVNGVGRSRLARLNSGGSLDTNFLNGVSGPDDAVFAMVEQSDGKVLIGGAFTMVNGITRRRIARLNTDGSLDRGFQEGLSGTEYAVNAMALQPDGKVLIGGCFSTVNGVGRVGIARLNTDGSLDGTFSSGIPAGGCTVTALALQSNGKVLLGGWFTFINGASRGRVARLNNDGTLDAAFLDGPSGANNVVRSIAVQADNQVLIGGSFVSVNGVPMGHIARLWGTAPAFIESVSRPTGGSTELTLRLPSATTNRVQYKTNLTDPAWSDLPGDEIGSGSDQVTNKADPTIGTAERRFYRVRVLP